MILKDHNYYRKKTAENQTTWFTTNVYSMVRKLSRISFTTPLFIGFIGILIAASYSLVVYSGYVINNEGTTLTVYENIKASIHEIHASTIQYVVSGDKKLEEKINELTGAIWWFNTLLRDGGDFNGKMITAAQGAAVRINKDATDKYYLYTVVLGELKSMPLIISDSAAEFNEILPGSISVSEDSIVAVSDTVHSARINPEIYGKLDQLTTLKDELTDLYQVGYYVYDNIFREKQKLIRIGIFVALSLSVLSLVLTYIFVLKGMIIKPLKKISDFSKEVAKGDVSASLAVENDSNEIGELSTSINNVIERFRDASRFAADIGSGRFESDFKPASEKDELGIALSGMRDSLKKIAAEDKKRNWSTEGYARFGELIRNEGDSLEEMGYQVISSLVKYLKACQGALFILEEEDGAGMLAMKGCYAYERRKYLTRKLLPGEGFVGQCFLEKDIVYLTNIPPDYIKITSGLGGARPGSLLVSPLMINEEALGVIEIASFNQFENHEIEFVRKVSETIAAAVSSLRISERTNRLLAESQSLTTQMKSQEEEMRQNVEELMATQEEMARKQQELISMKEEMEKELLKKEEIIQRLVSKP